MRDVFNKVRVLVVDDHESMRRIITTLLRAFGFSTLLEATDGDEALRLIQTFEPDVIITDLKMPVLNGIDLVQALRADKANKFCDVPVIMVTGHASETVIRTAIAAGIDQFLAKPITPRSLAERLRRLAA